MSYLVVSLPCPLFEYMTAESSNSRVSAQVSTFVQIGPAAKVAKTKFRYHCAVCSAAHRRAARRDACCRRYWALDLTADRQCSAVLHFGLPGVHTIVHGTPRVTGVPCPASQAQEARHVNTLAAPFDRTVLPIPETEHPPITEIDARKATPPTRFDSPATAASTKTAGMPPGVFQGGRVQWVFRRLSWRSPGWCSGLVG